MATGSAAAVPNGQHEVTSNSTATPKASGFGQLLQSARQSITNNTDVFSEGLHKVVGGSTETQTDYDSDSPEVGSPSKQDA